MVSITNAIKVFKEYSIIHQEESTDYLTLNVKHNDVVELIAHIYRYKT